MSASLSPLALQAALPVDDPGFFLTRELVSIIDRYADEDCPQTEALPGLGLYRRTSPSEPTVGIYQAALAMVVQGAKRVTLGGESYVYGKGDYLLVTVDLPVTWQIIAASPEEPYLCLTFALDSLRIGEVMAEAGLTRPKAGDRGLQLSGLDRGLLETVLRLVRLLDQPADIPFLAPIIEREIIYRLLTGGQGAVLRHIARTDGQTHQIARAIDWLKANFSEPLSIGALARQVNMSPSSLHHQFKELTALSPLQYQKRLRLQEARRLMLTEGFDAASAGHRVGYGSPSQFSREYSRLYGVPPRQDMARLVPPGRSLPSGALR